MTDLIFGIILAGCLIGIGWLFINHSRETREAMFREMERLEKEEWEDQESDVQPEKKTKKKTKK